MITKAKLNEISRAEKIELIYENLTQEQKDFMIETYLDDESTEELNERIIDKEIKNRGVTKWHTLQKSNG